jgi:hypothetical protein
LAYSISRREFEKRTLRLLKMTREALIYLSLSIYAEEKNRAQKRDNNDFIPQMPLGILEDEWKV